MLRSLIWFAPILALLVALTDMPYGYYQLLRILIFCASAYFAKQEYDRASAAWTWTFVALALVYNPVAKLALGPQIWVIVNAFTIAVLAANLWARKGWRAA